MGCGATGDTVMGGGEERGAPGELPRDREGDDGHPHEDTKKAPCGQAGSGDHCKSHHVDFLMGSYPRGGQDALIQKTDKLDDKISGILQDQAIFDNNLKTIRLHREDYDAKLESMLVQQQRVVDNMIKYLQTVGNRMRELEKRGGIPTPVPGPGPHLPRDRAPELLLRRVTTLRTAAEGVAPMEGPLESQFPLFSASVMRGRRRQKKARGAVRPSTMPVRRPCTSTWVVLQPRRRSTPELPKRHLWTKKPRGQRLAEIVQVEEQKIHGCGILGQEAGLREVQAWEKLSSGRVKTWKPGVYIPTPQAMGGREESASRTSSLRMLGMP